MKKNLAGKSPRKTNKDEKTILIKNADYVVTMDEKKRILRNCSLLISGNKIDEVQSKKTRADRIINASGMVILPGFINTHLHTPQIYHRHCPAQQNRPIADWISITTSINRELDEETAYYGALVCFAELMLSGVTTTADYFYPFPRGKRNLIETVIKAALDIGIRFTAIRGSMSLSKRQGTLYDEDIVESTEEIIETTKMLVEEYHDSSLFSMTKIGAGPCLPWASTKKDYMLAASLVERYEGLILQTHLAESIWEYNFIKEKYGISPFKLMQDCGFVGRYVSFVHCNIINKNDLDILSQTQTNVVVCPVCNTRDASDGNGIAPLSQLVERRINISLGCDGAASNDSQNFLEEMRFFRTVSPGREGLFYYDNDSSMDQKKFTYYHPLEVYQTGTVNGAQTLNRSDIGSIEEDKAADIVIFDPNSEISYAGTLNKWGALISCQAISPKYLIINGNLVIEDKKITTVDIDFLNKRFRQLHKKIIRRAEKRLRLNLTDYL